MTTNKEPAMKVTIKFMTMPGDVQVDSVALRINTLDHADAVARAMAFAASFTSVSVETVEVSWS